MKQAENLYEFLLYVKLIPIRRLLLTIAITTGNVCV